MAADAAGASGKRQMPPSPVWRAVKTTVRYHLGTLAFGSCIIAVIRFIRACIEYVDQRVKKASGDSRLVRAVMCCCRCCFWCLEKCMRFINRNAYVMTVLTKQGFCSSAASAFKLIMSNLARVGALTVVGNSFIFLGKLFVTAVGASIAWFTFTGSSTFNDIGSDMYVAPLFPVMLTALLCWSIGSSIMGVFNAVQDTLLLCFCFGETRPELARGDTMRELGDLNGEVDTGLKSKNKFGCC